MPYNVMVGGDLVMYARMHGITRGRKDTKPVFVSKISNHSCSLCMEYYTVVRPSMSMEEEILKKAARLREQVKAKALAQKEARRQAKDIHPDSFVESGCCVCGALAKQRGLLDLRGRKNLIQYKRYQVLSLIENGLRVTTSTGQVGRAKMIANVIMFANPTVEVYNKLPPSREELSEVLAFIFMGSTSPTPEDFKRTPMLDYADLTIDRENLASYDESGVPVFCDYKPLPVNMAGNVLPSEMSKHEVKVERGTSDGPCPFTVHGLTGVEYENMTIDALKAKALRHLEDGGSFLMAKRQNFEVITQKILGLNKEVLKDIADRMANGEHVRPKTDEEKECFQLLDMLDHVGGHVKGSLTNRKYMRNEIWSLLAFKGAPSWFITFAPADNRHPLSLYYASDNLEFKPEILTSKQREKLCLSNPVAAAKFFNVLVELFIKHVLGVGADHDGLYGKTNAYYGTVEQQGRLTLHLHMMIWIAGALSPQDVRDRLMNQDSEFQKALIEYMEGVHQGEFITGSIEEVKTRVPYDPDEEDEGFHGIEKERSSKVTPPGYVDPTLTLPEEPPEWCEKTHDSFEACQKCAVLAAWKYKFNHTVDDIVLRTHFHKCRAKKAPMKDKKSNADDVQVKLMMSGAPKGCLTEEGINGYLRQEFLRPLRNPTIRAFQKWASENNIDYSSKWHKSLQWRKNEKIIQEPEKDGTWNLAYAKTREVIEREKNQLGKRKATGNSGQEVSRRKRQVTTLAPNPLNLPSEGR
ncbi:hypothetical protein CC1G_11343 [Coprinopsis cinerea okayama7|uniref:Helitron helicase-like domain-containing protein n=1 Tax=Coprinopsis cinerea (strain Okayama-7 / 130 / ATCC MYA-4618 / FGSC 9003) TaxID=240176 RepID=A8P8T8_COPC7|nr:hypothetical protein CC1G_11343 [Coprinopsis cinerea okayama7\|eukprot:XP_001839632.2 hypothetical protein CC1G_11343 [Coprinopsis cinerea okayama7\